MRLLILGGAGMLGHKLWQVCRDRCDTWITVRGLPRGAAGGVFDPSRTLRGVDAADFDGVVQALEQARPDAVVNCIGIVKQVPAAKDPIASLTVNALLPHRLAALCRVAGARLIHVSTDCVFSGRKGMYTERDAPDAEDLYGRSKLLGEVTGACCLTLRTSIIGRELSRQSGLLEWFLAHRHEKIRGYTNAIFSGFTTQALAELMAGIITDHPNLAGLYHVASEPISKYSLLTKISKGFGFHAEIEPYADYRCDRSLDSARFWSAIGGTAPEWEAMVEELAADSTPYDDWRGEQDA